MEISSNLVKYQNKNCLKIFFIKLFIKRIIKIIEKFQADNILDVGCGEGIIIYEISQKIPKIRIDGLDISSQSIQLAKKLLPDNIFFVGDIIKMPFSDNTYDLTIALEVLEHLAEPELALQELKRVTRKYCLISVPREYYFSLGNFFFGRNIKNMGRDPEHLQFWNKKQIVNLVSQYFKIITVKTSFPWTLILAQK